MNNTASRIPPIHVIVTTLVALALVATPGAAQTPTEELRVHASRAEGAYALGEFAEAAREYELAFKLKPQPALLFNAAQAHRLAGNQQRARALYQSYLKVYGSRITNRAEVEDLLRKLDAAAAVTKVASENPPLGTVPVPPIPAAEPTAPVATTNPVPATTTVTPPPLAPSPTPPPPAAAVVVAPAPKPLVRRPALWAGIVVGAIVIGGGVTAGIVIGTAPHGPTAREQFVFQGLSFGGGR